MISSESESRQASVGKSPDSKVTPTAGGEYFHEEAPTLARPALTCGCHIDKDGGPGILCEPHDNALRTYLLVAKRVFWLQVLEEGKR